MDESPHCRCAPDARCTGSLQMEAGLDAVARGDVDAGWHLFGVGALLCEADSYDVARGWPSEGASR